MASEPVTAGFNAWTAFWNWMTGREKNKPGQQTREEIQTIRRTRDEEIQYNADAVRYGVNPDGSVRYPVDK